MTEPAKTPEIVKPVKPLKRKQEKETPTAAAIRRRLLEMIDRPLIAKNVQELQALAAAVVGFLQATGTGVSGLPKSRRISPLLPQGYGGYYAGVPTAFGVVPIDEMRDMFGSRFDPGNAPTLFMSLKALVKRSRFAAAGLAWRLTAGKPEDREPEFASELRAKLRELLAQPMTTRNAVAFSRVVDAVVPLVQIGGAARARDRFMCEDPLGAYESSIPIMGPNPNPWGVADMPDEAEEADAPNEAAGTDTQPATDGDAAEATAAAEPLEFDDMMSGFGGGFMPYAPASARENFGAKAMREILAALPKILGAKTRSPTEMVKAICEAELAGMPKLAAKLREQLGVRDPNEGEMPDYELDPAEPAKDETEQKIDAVQDVVNGGVLGLVTGGDEEAALDVGIGAFAAASQLGGPRVAGMVASAMSSVAAEIDETDKQEPAPGLVLAGAKEVS